MKVLLIGGGGREHALGWALAAHEGGLELISAPGNPGLASIGAVVPGIDVTDGAAVTELALANGVDLVVVGPEAPLAAGVVDALSASGVAAFGPTRAAARLEASKAFAKRVMAEAGVPTAAAQTFTDAAEAAAHLARRDPPYVVKADGLAAGKGVLVTEDRTAAEAWARLCLDGHFGEAGATVVIEDHLDGDEVSVFALCDGTRAVPLEPARDYKRLRDGDEGPNTGGMGAYSPPRDLPPDLVSNAIATVVEPVLERMAAAGAPYRGFLYAGLVLTSDGPKVLEFNCRLGDPETQVVLPRLATDLADLLTAAAGDGLGDMSISWTPRAAVDVVLAAPGYPESPAVGAPIRGDLDMGDDVLVFHAGTARTAGGIVTRGGRVLNVVGVADTVAAARKIAYERADQIEFEGKQMRRDIAS